VSLHIYVTTVTNGVRLITSPAEQHLARDLRSVLRDVEIGDRIPESEVFRDALSALEYYIPEVLREVHPEWKHESLDAVFPECSTKSAEHEIDIVGTCIVISDQTMVPTHTRIRVSATTNAIVSMQCKLGELAGKAMERIPYGGNHGCRLHVASREETIQWAYDVAFGVPKGSREC
jgi:hypothetical protein